MGFGNQLRVGGHQLSHTNPRQPSRGRKVKCNQWVRPPSGVANEKARELMWTRCTTTCFGITLGMQSVDTRL